MITVYYDLEKLYIKLDDLGKRKVVAVVIPNHKDSEKFMKEVRQGLYECSKKYGKAASMMRQNRTILLVNGHTLRFVDKHKKLDGYEHIYFH